MNLQQTGGKRDDVPVFAWDDLMPGSNRNLFGTAKNISSVAFLRKADGSGQSRGSLLAGKCGWHMKGNKTLYGQK